MASDTLAQISFKAPPKLKERALAKTQREGITLKALLSLAMQAYVDDEFEIGLRKKGEIPSPFLIQAMKKANEEYERGDFVSFDNSQDAIAYLNRFKTGRKGK